jgi:adenine-specific DNA-methyltransferase
MASDKKTRVAMSMNELPLDLVHRGDCLDLLRRLPDGSVDLIVSSPPYNLGKEYEDRRELQAYLAEQRIVLAECARLLSDKGSIFWQVGAYSNRGALIPLDIRFFPILEDLELVPRNRIMWVRQHGLHGRRKFSARHESLLWFTKTDHYLFNLDAIRVPQKYQNKKAWKGDNRGELTCHPDGKNPGDIWVFRNVKHNHEEQTIHPCQFPEDLVARIVLATTDPGDVVLDPYMGTGTVAIVARDEGRRYLGAELDPEYHAVCLQRLSGEPNEDGVFPNLKTLRNYAERTGTPASRYRFAKQVGRVATERSQAKIYPEEHHRQELEKRLAYEEDCFAAGRRGEPRPDSQDYLNRETANHTNGHVAEPLFET